MNNDRPWMTALEMQFAALSYANQQHVLGTMSEHGYKGVTFDDGLRGGLTTRGDELARTAAEVPHANRLRRIHALRRAETFAWTPDIIGAVAVAARTMPVESKLSRRQWESNASCWWWFGDGMPIRVNAGGDPNVCAMLLAPQPHGLEIVGLMPTFDERQIPVPFDSWLWPWDTGLDPDRMGRPAVRGDEPMVRQELARRRGMFELSRFVLAAAAWLRQRVIVYSLGHVERHRRKQLAREHDAVVSDVKVIQLRRAESQPREPTESGNTVEWSCRWIVNGHWRNQPYKDERKLIYILPFVKGPEDKPLKTPSHTVYAVNR